MQRITGKSKKCSAIDRLIGQDQEKREPSGCNHIHASALAVEMDNPAGESEEGIVFGPADVTSGVEAGAPLSNDNAAGRDRLAAEYLNAQALTVGFPAVANRALTFLMSHDFSKF
jgi:hypothetical protein